MTEEEKLQNYLKENAVKAKKNPRPAPKIKKEEPPAGKTAFGVYTHRILSQLILLVLSSLVVGFISALAYYELTKSEEKAVFYTQITVVAVVVIAVANWAFRFIEFRNWTQGVYYPLKGWDNFVAQRSPDFWKPRDYYTTIKISVTLKKTSTSLQQEAVELFMKNWPDKWGKPYSKMGGWEPGWGRPGDFIARGPSVSGDVSISELNKLITLLTRRFIPLAKLLGQDLEAVVIESSARENHNKREKIKEDVYDRAN